MQSTKNTIGTKPKNNAIIYAFTGGGDPNMLAHAQASKCLLYQDVYAVAAEARADVIRRKLKNEL